MLRDKISEILYTQWNPIGVPGLPRNEYDAYVPEIVDFIMCNEPFRDGDFIESLARLLTGIEKEQMGLSQNKDKALKVAKMIHECLVVTFEVGNFVVFHTSHVDFLKKFHGKICVIHSILRDGYSACVLCEQYASVIYDDECIPA